MHACKWVCAWEGVVLMTAGVRPCGCVFCEFYVPMVFCKWKRLCRTWFPFSIDWNYHMWTLLLHVEMLYWGWGLSPVYFWCLNWWFCEVECTNFFMYWCLGSLNCNFASIVVAKLIFSRAFGLIYYSIYNTKWIVGVLKARHGELICMHLTLCWPWCLALFCEGTFTLVCCAYVQVQMGLCVGKCCLDQLSLYVPMAFCPWRCLRRTWFPFSIH